MKMMTTKKRRKKKKHALFDSLAGSRDSRRPLRRLHDRLRFASFFLCFPRFLTSP
jgi:tetratricopeptide (TPR) repeat protein